VSLEREAAIINQATHENNKAAGALDFDLQVQDMSKVSHTYLSLCSLSCFHRSYFYWNSHAVLDLLEMHELAFSLGRM
jgi:hypothetical protein